MSTIIEVQYFNSYMLKAITVNYGYGSTFPGVAFPGSIRMNNGSFGVTAFDVGSWMVEESRIRGGYNNVSTDLGVRAYLDEENPLQQNRISTLIYSGVYNSRTGINQTNVFSVGDAITKSLDPVYGSIQKTYAEETNLIVFQENRIHRALIDKDTIYTTESGTQTQAGAAVISKNPESFAIYNYRKYFSDKNRNAIMRLSNDGLTEVSMYGMRDYFRDELAEISNSNTTNTFTADYVSGGSVATTEIIVLTSSITSGQNITPGMKIQGQSGYVTYLATSGLNTKVYYSQAFSPAITGPTVTFEYNTRGRVKGGWDIHNKNYVVSLQKSPTQVTTEEDSYKTISFDEEINGWVSFFDYKPVQMFSMIL